MAWRERVRGIDPTRWVWVDEFGSHLGLIRTHARAPRGKRAHGSAPRNRGQNRTTITALTLDGLGPGLLVDGGITTAGFAAYAEAVLAPTLRPGQIVVLDNLRQHRRERVRAAIEARGAELWFLPSYSPDLNPIEEAFARRSRRCSARPRPAPTRHSPRRSGRRCGRSPRPMRVATSSTAATWPRHGGAARSPEHPAPGVPPKGSTMMQTAVVLARLVLEERLAIGVLELPRGQDGW